jgi:hypothetical protein
VGSRKEVSCTPSAPGPQTKKITRNKLIILKRKATVASTGDSVAKQSGSRK